jgi:hypothetical protein
MTNTQTIAALPEPRIAKLLCAMLEPDVASPLDYSDAMTDAIFDAMHGDLTALQAIAEQPIGEAGRDHVQELADYRSAT